jgi:hypothetical protein
MTPMSTSLTTHETSLHTDYLIVGSGAMGMAFADTIFHESDARLVIVDRHHAPGGHWNDAYPFVRLHQPSSFYGVNSRALGTDALDRDPLNVGMTERASAAEILAYYEAVMRVMTDSGRVQYLPMSEVALSDAQVPGEVQVTSRLSGAATTVRVARKLVDTSFLNTAVPATHPPKYALAEGVTCVPLNDLVKLTTQPPRYVVVGAGKTGVDACLWLLQTGVPAERITWVMPRDSWFQNRHHLQAGDAFFLPTIGGIVGQFEAIVQAESMADLFLRLEAQGQLLRLDPAVEPSMYHAAVMSPAELTLLRSIGHVVRKGRVERIEPGRLVLQQGTEAIEPGSLIVDCSASAVQAQPAVPVFSGNRITPQMIQAYQPTFSAALIAHVERLHSDEALKNKLCKPVPLPDGPASWLTMQAASLTNRYHWGRDPKIAPWILASRLDGFTKMIDAVQEDEAEKVALLERLGAAVPQVVSKLPQLLATAA